MRTKRHFVGWKYDTGSPGSRYHEADTLAAAIRDAGVRCETCEHYYQVGKDGDIGECGADWRDTGSGGEATRPNYFCHNHSLLTQPSEV